MVTWQYWGLLAALLAVGASAAPEAKAEWAAGVTLLALAAAITSAWTAL